VSNETTTGDVKRGDTVGHIFTAPDGTVYTPSQRRTWQD
jgi:hypothetical protein